MAITATPGYQTYTGSTYALPRKRKTMGTVLGGASYATKAALLPYQEGQLGISGVPKVKLPSLIPGMPAMTPVVTPGGGAAAAAKTAADVAGGLDPVYGKELSNDEMWQIAQRNYENTLNMGERSTFGDPFRAALVQYGMAPDLSKLSPELRAEAQKWLTPDAIAAATTNNPYSTTGQISHNFGQADASIAPGAAMRGLLLGPGQGSGGMAITQSNLDYARGLQNKTALDQFLGQVGTANQNWVDFQAQALEILRAAQEAVANRLAQQPGYHGPETPDRGPYEGTVSPYPAPVGADLADYPNIYASGTDVPGDFEATGPTYSSPSPFVPVVTGSDVSFEPKPFAGNIIPASPAAATTLSKVKAKASPSPMYKALHLADLLG